MKRWLSYTIILVIILMSSLLIRTIFSMYIGLYVDETNYVFCSLTYDWHNFLGGRVYSSLLAPLLTRSFFILENQTGLRLFNIFTGILTVLAIYLLGKKIHKDVGLLAAILATFSSMLIYVSATVRFEGPSITFLLFRLYFLLLAFEKNKYYFLSVPLFILSFLMKYNSIIIIIPILVYYLIKKPFERKHITANLFSILFFIAIYFSSQLQHLNTLLDVTQALHINQNANNFFLIFLTLSPLVLTTPIILFKRKDFKNKDLFSLCYFITFISVFVFTFVGTAVFLPIYLSFVFPFAILACSTILAHSRIGYVVAAIVCIVMVLNIFSVIDIPLSRQHFYGYPDWRPAAEWLKINADTNDKIIASHPSPLWFYTTNHFNKSVDCTVDMLTIKNDFEFYFSAAITNSTDLRNGIYRYVITFKPVNKDTNTWTLLDTDTLHQNMDKFVQVFSYNDGPYNVHIYEFINQSV